MQTIASSQAAMPGSAGRWCLLLGMFLIVLGPLLYALQLWLKVLSMPWYVLGLAACGVLLLLFAVLRQPGLGRILALVFFGVFAAGQAYFLLALSKVPTYTGPVAVGSPFPAFATTFADGSPFTQESLHGDKNSAIIFFRGRW